MQVLIEDYDSESMSSESNSPMEDVDTLSEKTHGSTGDRIISQLFVFLLVWQTAFKVSTAAIHNIFKFFKFFISAVGKAYDSDQLSALVGAIPVTKHTMCKVLGLNKYKKYRKYVVCSKCSSVYDLNFCLSDLSTANKVCPHVQFPNHPQKSHRQACGGHLLHKMQLKSRTVYRPIKAYPYRSIRDSLSLNFTLIAFKGEHTSRKHLRDHQDGRDPSAEKGSPVALSIGQKVVIVIHNDAKDCNV